ncbi:MAG: RDD family protein [Chitinivibrionales bacterium]|nr:RDD family protein [Chitinivibrionales bacterium]
MAEWYYTVNSIKNGPVSEAEFQGLIDTGVVSQTTLVWSPTMSQWKELKDTEYSARHPQQAQAVSATPKELCSLCSRPFDRKDMMQFDTAWVCAACKPGFVRKLKEGGEVLTGGFMYAGFWKRMSAVSIDGLIFLVLFLIIGGGFGLLLPGLLKSNPDALSSATFIGFFMQLFSQVVYMIYEVVFIWKTGATPGKMVMRIKVITPEGGNLTLGRSLGRYFGKMLSGLTLGIGYIIAAFDEEKKALHDRICETRVVEK